MITYNINSQNRPINEKGEVVILKSYPHFNGEWVIIFDTIEEHGEYLTTLN